jgi:hypothetical protein
VYLPFPLLPIVDEMTLFLEFLEKLLKPTQQRGFGRPAKILIWSPDGFTENALSLIIAMRGMALPEVYLELQASPTRTQNQITPKSLGLRVVPPMFNNDDSSDGDGEDIESGSSCDSEVED